MSAVESIAASVLAKEFVRTGQVNCPAMARLVRDALEPITRGLLANAACIAAEVRSLEPNADIARHYDEIVDAAIALGEIEASPGFLWESAPNDWESTCYDAATLIVRAMNTNWLAHFAEALRVGKESK